MGNPVFKFTLSHTPRPSVSLPVILPNNSLGQNIDSVSLPAKDDWTESETPSVTVSGSIILPNRDSEIWANDFIFGTGLEYTISYNIDYNIPFATSNREVHFLVLDAANNILFDDTKTISFSGAGTLNESSTFTAQAGAVKYGFQCGVTNTLANAGSFFEIQNNITGTVSSTGESGNPSSVVITEPMAWKDSKLKMERHPDFHSLVEYFETGLTYYGENNVDNGGIDFLKSLESQYGFDTSIEETVEADIDGDGVFEENIFTGLKDLTALQEVPDNKMEVPTIRNDLWSKFISRLDTPVDLRSITTLDGGVVSPVEPVDVDLPSQIVRKVFNGEFSEPTLFIISSANGYAQFYPDHIVTEEIKEFQGLYSAFNPEIPVDVLNVVEGNAGIYTFDIRLTISAHVGVTIPPGDVRDSFRQISAGWKIFFKKNSDTPIEFNALDVDFPSPPSAGSGWTVFTFSATLNLIVGDQIRIYGEEQSNLFTALTIWTKRGAEYDPLNGDPAVYENPTGYNVPSYFLITADTTYPQSEAKGFYLHDAFAGVIERIIGRSDVFYSEILGRIDTNMRQYDSNGCYSRNVILRGLQMRGYSLEEKPFSVSFNQLWKGADPIFNLGLGYETIGDSEYLRIEDKAYFYDNDVSIDISNVRQITREYDPDKIYNKIEVGYTKWQSEDVSGLDDPQTKRVYATRISNVKKSLAINSDFIAASVAIETTRRKSIEKSKDYKYDNETFIISINDNDVSPDRYTPELDENFNSITGLIQSGTRYNNILTPMRSLLRWGNVWNGCLQKYQNSFLKFVSGEGNFDMSSDYSCSTGYQCLGVICDNLSEKQDIPLGSPSNYGSVFGYLHLPEVFTIDIINFTWNAYKAIRNNRSNSIRISQTETDHKRFKIKEIIYEVCKGKCRIVAWPYDEFNISVVTTGMPERSCTVFTITDVCEDEDQYEAEYRTIIEYGRAQGYGLPSCAQRLLQNQMVIDLKAAGIWDDLDLLYVFATDGDREFAKINWKNPSSFRCSEVDGPTFTENEGFNGNGTSQYLNTGWVSDDDAVNYQVDDCSTFCYMNTEASVLNAFAYGVRGNSSVSAAAGNISFTPVNTSNFHSIGLQNPFVNAGTAPVSGQGLFHTRRVSVNDLRLFKDGAQVDFVTNGSDVLSTNELYLLVYNANGSLLFHSDAQMSFFGAGASLSGLESDLNDIWNDYFTSL